MDQSLLIPVKVEAFIFNKAVVNGYDEDIQGVPKNVPKYRIAPITQPNYSFVRLDQTYLQPDLMNNIDLHAAWPAKNNSRLTNLSTKKQHQSRQGVYIHWTLPRAYRMGVSSFDDRGNQIQIYPDVPTRWLVVRKIDNMSTFLPQEARESGLVKEFTAWVVESDRKSKIDDIPEAEDLQVNFAPFLFATDEKTNLSEQAEIFIGKKSSAESWKEESKSKNSDFVKLKLLGSSNELFTDYQPHCSNVFSTLDNFQYDENDKTKILTQVDASYYVVGWHANPENDIFNIVQTSKDEKEKQTREGKLSSLNMKIKGRTDTTALPENMKTWLEQKISANTISHGSIYNVRWNSSKRPKSVPADKFGEVLHRTLPVGIGTTPMDALMTYVSAHQDLADPDTDFIGNVDPPPPVKKKPDAITNLKKALLSLETYLFARDDGVETQMQAADLLYNWNYLRLDGGNSAHLASKDERAQPIKDDTQRSDLDKLNHTFRLQDSAIRKKRQLQWNLFSEWWKYVTLTKEEAKKKQFAAASNVKNILDGLIQLEDCIKETQKTIDDIMLKYPKDMFQKGTLPPFYQQRDPTILVGGIRSGWQSDFLDALKIRLDSQVMQDKTPKGDEAWKSIISKVLPTRGQMSVSAISLFREFLLLQTNKDNKPQESIDSQAPLFHDTLGPKKQNPWRDDFNDTQPWSPLFMEWEIEYFHIPDDKWTMEKRKLRHQQASKLHYVIKEDVDLEKDNENPLERNDLRFSGRTLILPQPSFSLEAKIQQLFDDTPDDLLDNLVHPDTRALLHDRLYELAFLSAPLSGLTSQMTTIDQGNHVKPLLKDPATGSLIPITEALRSEIGLDWDSMLQMDLKTDVTPYGTSRTRTSPFASFKPVTHGQFRFAQLNIIDKFGQCISALDPTPSAKNPNMWPCITEWFEPQLKAKSDTIPNVIETDKSDPTRCEFAQIPLQINQPARLNSVFVVPNKTPDKLTNPSLWKTANEWDNPIWGWVVVNYANYGIQLFLADGTFYREVRLAGPGNALDSPAWLPFAPPKNPEDSSSPSVKQLSLLVNALVSTPEYLTRFVTMINKASAAVKPPPNAYAEFTNALVGRPLALVHMGWSVELEAEAITSQLEDDKTVEDDKKEKKLKDYDFKIQIGDMERTFDGLIGFFNLKAKDAQVGDALNCDQVYSHYAPDSPVAPTEPTVPKSTSVSTTDGKTEKGVIIPVDKSNYFSLKAFWINPIKKTPDQYAQQLVQKLHVVGGLIDPFTPVHAYSGILPVRELSLPNWTWQSSMDKMKAFFHAGPVLVPNDVPNFLPDRKLLAGKPLEVVKPGENERGVALPSVSTSQWAWLQPYWDDRGQPPNVPIDPIVGSTSFMALAIDTTDEKARLEEGPYTALDGYLQLVTNPNENSKANG